MIMQLSLPSPAHVTSPTTNRNDKNNNIAAKMAMVLLIARHRHCCRGRNIRRRSRKRRTINSSCLRFRCS